MKRNPELFQEFLYHIFKRRYQMDEKSRISSKR
jgi:hypothetical protein